MEPMTPLPRAHTASTVGPTVAAVIAQWQQVADLLEDAARACNAQAYAGGIDDRLFWLIDAEQVRDAADSLRLAAPDELPVNFPTHIIGPAGRTAAYRAAVDVDPVPLLEQAWTQLQLLPDEPENVELLVATFAIADALNTVRDHRARPR